MSAWRRKAIEAFPERRRELNDMDEIFSVYALWFELLPLAEEAHREGNDDVLRRIYGYAEWCSRQRGDLSNAVFVSFYEHSSTSDGCDHWLFRGYRRLSFRTFGLFGRTGFRRRR